MTVTSAIERLERLDPMRAVVDAVNLTKDQYADLNREQLAAGKLDNGQDIQPPYSSGYAKTRRKEGLQTDHVDLKRTGNLYSNYKATVEAGKINLTSDVSYEKYVSKRYSEKIYGLTEENMVKYRAIVRPLIQAEVKAQYNG